MLFAKRFLFFPPVESAIISFGHLSYGGFYYMQGDGFAVPLHPLRHSQLKTWKPEPNKWVNTPQGRQGALAPWHKTILAKQNDLKKKAIVKLQRQ